MFPGTLLPPSPFLSGSVTLSAIPGLAPAGEPWAVFLPCGSAGRDWLLLAVGFRAKLGRTGWVGVGPEAAAAGVCCVRRVRFCT